MNNLYVTNISIHTYLNGGQVIKSLKKTIVYLEDEKELKATDLFTNDTYPTIKRSNKFKEAYDHFFIDPNQKLIPFNETKNKESIIVQKKSYTRDEIIKLYNDKYKLTNSDNSRTLAIIKPDGMKNIDKIIEMIYKSDLKIDKYKIEYLNEDILAEHYSHLLDKPFYPKLKNYMMSDAVAIMILKGENAVEKLRNLMGPTDSTKAEKGTIRGEFGTDITYNAIHGSDSNENAEIEINRFFNQKQKRI